MREYVYTASTMIVSLEKVLLHFHPKFNLWLQIGGHIESHELPHEAALRETKEEVGLNVTLYNPDKILTFSDAEYVPRPMHIVAVEGLAGKQFVDFLYYASILGQPMPSNSDTQYRWFSDADIKNLQSWHIPENIRYFALEAIKLLS